MGFILDGLDTEAYDREYGDRVLLARILSYFRPFGRQVLYVAVALTINSVAGSGAPIAIARAIDVVGKNPSLTSIALSCGLVLLMGGLAWISNFARQWLSARVIGDVVLKLREDVFDATVRHDMSFYDEHPSGKIVSRVTSDTQDFSEVVTLVVNLLSQFMQIGILTIWLMSINTGLSLILYAMAPLAVRADSIESRQTK